MSILEILGFITGVIGVWLTAKGNVLCWPVGLVNVMIYLIIFYNVRLFGDMWLQGFYLLMGVIGWIQWNKKRTEMFTANDLTIRETITLSILILVSYFIIYIILKHINSSLPAVDSFTTTLSLAATWLTIKKKIENWHIWIITDLVYTAMYINKELYLTAILYFIFTILAVYGLFEWRKKIL